MKKIISLFLSFLMVAALLPFNVWAAELEENAPAEENKIIEETEPVFEESEEEFFEEETSVEEDNILEKTEECSETVETSVYNRNDVVKSNSADYYIDYFISDNRKIYYNDYKWGTTKGFAKTFDGMEMEYVVVPGYGNAKDYDEIDVTGKIALVKRGNIAFSEKEANAVAAGAVGMICYNNVSGSFVNMSSEYKIPAIFIHYGDGISLINKEEKTISISTEYSEVTEFVELGYCGKGENETDIIWTLDQKGVLTISGKGPMVDYTYTYVDEEILFSAPWKDFNINELVIEDGITSIGNYAFYNCEKMNGSIDIPDSVVTIGERAFMNCEGLTGDLVIPDRVTTIGNNAFYGCNGFTGTLDISGSVKSIGSYAFYGCDGFTGALNIPGSVISIGPYAFYGCNGFTGALNIPGSVTSIGTYAFYNCSGFSELKLPNSITEISNYAFSGCTNFKGTLTIPRSVTKIGNYAFQNCSGFTGTLTIPRSVTTIGNYAFSNCDGFSGDLIIPDNVTGIGDYAFNDCGGFNGKLTLSNSITRINDFSFYNCIGFTGDLIIPENVSYIDPYAFAGCSGFNGKLYINEDIYRIYKYAFSGCSGFTGELVIPSRISSIGEGIFSGCSGFTGELVINVTNISDSAFSGCSGIDKLTIGKKVKTIENKAFENCTGLSGKVTLPESITNIGAGAFSTCSNLKSYYFEGEAPIIIAAEYENRTFATDVTLYYLEGFEYWTEPTYEGYNTKISNFYVEFNANGGINAPKAQYKTAKKDLTLTKEIPEKVGYTFLGWATTADATTAEYQQGAIYSSDKDIVLYAVWQKNEGVVDAGYCGAEGDGTNLSWIVDQNGVLTINGNGLMTNYYIDQTQETPVTTAPWVKHSPKALVIKNGATSIGKYAFLGCTALTGSLVIPESVTTIGEFAFTETGIKSINVSERNSSYCSVNGILYSKDKKIIIACPREKTGTISIQESVIEIKDCAFANCTGITGDIEIPENVTTIGAEAFYGCCVDNFIFKGDAPIVVSSSFDSDDTIYYPLGNATWKISNGKWNGYTAKLGNPDFNLIDYGYCGAESEGANISWFIDKNGVLTIAGKGAMASYTRNHDGNTWHSSAPWNVYEEDIKEIVIGEGITSIGDYAFAYLFNIAEEITIPSDIKSVGQQAFIGTDAVYVIEGQPNLGWQIFSPWNTDTVKIYFMSGAPASIQSGTIGYNLTLYYLSGTEDKWTFDENGLWKGYTVLPYIPGEEVEYDPSIYVASGYCGADPLIDGKNAIWTLDQNGTLTIKGKGEMADYKRSEDENGYSITSADWGKYKDQINKLVIEEGITGIGSFSFWCMRFDSGYSIPKTAKTIGRQAFQSCRLNGELVLHEGIEKIDSWAFGNNNITAVTIPSTANYIVSEAFVGCASLENFKVSENNPNYCDIEGILCSKDGKTLMSYPCGRKGEVIIPESIEIIGNGAFTELASDVTIPETVKTIASNSFREFFGNAVIMGQPVIENWAFEDWSWDYNEGNIYFMNGEPAEASEYSFEDYDGRCKYNLYYLAGTEDKWTFDENGLWKGYEVKPFEASEGPEFDPEDYMASGYCGAELYGKNLVWTLDENGTLTIFGNGKMKDYEGGWDQAASEYYTTAPWNEYRYAVNKIVFEDGVTSIGNYAFYYFDNITKVIIIPEGIETIGVNAFNCVGATFVIEGVPKKIENSAFWSSAWRGIANVYFLKGAPVEENRSFGGNTSLYYLSGTENLWEFDENGLWNGYKVEPYTPGTEVELNESLYIASGYCGNDPVIENKNLAWGLDKNGTLTIFGSGKMFDYATVSTYGGGWQATNAPWFEYYESIKKIVIENGVTSIGSYAFQNLQYVENMPAIPSSVKNIGAHAFSGIYINGDLTIPEGVEKIGEWAFTGRGIKTVNIPSTLTDFIPDSFFGTVEKFVVSSNNPAFCAIDGVIFTKDKKTLYMVPDSVSGEYTVPDGTVTIGKYAFEYTNYSCVTLPESVKNIEGYAFRGADVSVVVNGVLNNVGNSAFGAWENNTINVYFMNGAPISVDSEAFEYFNTGKVNLYYLSGTENLWNFDSNGLWKGYEVKPYTKNPDVNLGNAWGTIGKGYCGGEPGGKNLGWVIDRYGKLTIKGKGAMANYTTVMGADGNWVSNAPWFEYNSKIKSLAFEEGITEIGSCAFHGMSATTAITLPNSLEKLGQAAFYFAKFKGTLTIPSSVKYIGIQAFSCCTGFTKIVLSEGVENIGFRAFSEVAVETFNIPASVKTIENQAFAFTKFKNINVAEENKFYCSVDGVLYTEDKTVLVQFPLGRTGEFVIPNTVKTVGESAFFNAKVTDITVPESVARLESGAFYNVLGKVYIEGQLDYLGASAFRVYNGEVSVYFKDGEPQQIGIGNESLDDGPFVINGDGIINIYYDIANKDKWTFDENGLWYGYEVKSNYRPGDVNGDYVIDVKDVYLTRLIAAKLIDVSDFEGYAADVDGNGRINVIDANLIRKFALNMISEFPVKG